MGRMSVSERRKLLLLAGSRVAARDGVAELTTRAVALEAGMPQGAFHYCFRSKEELLAELITLTAQRLTEAAVPAVDREAPLVDQFFSAFQGLWHSLTDTSGKQLSLYELTIYAVRTPGLQGLATAQYATYTKAAATFLEQLAADCDVVWLVELADLARLLVATFDGLGLSWLADPESGSTSIESSVKLLAVQFVGHTAAAPHRP